MDKLKDKKQQIIPDETRIFYNVNMNFSEILSNYLKKLNEEFDLIPILGCELEFYTNCSRNKIAEAIKLEVVAEKGENQVEIRFLPSSDIHALAHQIESIKKKILKSVKAEQSWASFKAKPFQDRPGSAMQIHLNFLYKYKAEVGLNPKYLNLAIGGLLHTLCDSMPIFAPTKSSYKRYMQSMETPTTISWGRNNRTAALRIVSNAELIKRIEHRVPCADAHVLRVCTAIIFGAYIGIKHNLQPPPETHGLAFSECYNLPTFLKASVTAQELLQKLKQY